MNIKVIGTGSSGNCFLIDDDLMIDAGLPYSKVKPFTKKVFAVLLTHIHGDHFNKDTIRKLYVNNEKILFVCGDFLVDDLHNVDIPDDNIFVADLSLYKMRQYKIAPFNLYHDVPNYGWRIEKDGHKHFHTTDTSTLDGIKAREYDSATIECNHDYDKAIEIIDKAIENGDFTHLQGAMNSHLSVQQAIDFVKKNKIKKFIPVHIGSSTKKEVIEALNSSGIEYLKGEL